mgnify:CR=1 FL=1
MRCVDDFACRRSRAEVDRSCKRVRDEPERLQPALVGFVTVAGSSGDAALSKEFAWQFRLAARLHEAQPPPSEMPTRAACAMAFCSACTVACSWPCAMMDWCGAPWKKPL